MSALIPFFLRDHGVMTLIMASEPDLLAGNGQFLDIVLGDALLTRVQVAAISGFAVHTLTIWAAAGRGPRITTVEGRPRCRVRDTREWLGAA